MEQVLREMGTFDKTVIAKRLGKFLAEARKAFDNFAIQNRNRNHYTAIHTDEDNHINTAIQKTVKAGIGSDPEVATPFRVKNDQNITIERNNINEIDDWTASMTEIIPKSPEDNNDHRYGFSIEKIKTKFIAFYKCLFSIN
jgi:hypothetical protein